MARVGYTHEQDHRHLKLLLAYHEPVAPAPEPVVRKTYTFDSISWSHLCLGIVDLTGAANRADQSIDRWTRRWCQTRNERDLS